MYLSTCEGFKVLVLVLKYSEMYLTPSLVSTSAPLLDTMVLEETGLCCQLICLKDASAYHQSNTNLRALIVFKDNVRGHLEAANRSNNGTFSKVLLQANTFISFIAQVMQWPPAIHNYIRKVRLKYQHVPYPTCFSFVFLCS